MANKSRQKKRAARVGFFGIHLRQAKASFIQIWYRPLGNILTLAVIAMALSLPTSIYLVTKNVAKVSEGMTSPASISAYIEEDIAEARIMVLKDQIENWENVASVQYISSQQGLSDMSEYSGFDQAISLLTDYSLPAVLVVQPSATNDQDIKSIASAISKEQGITDVRLDEDWLARLDAIKHLAITVVVTLAVLMLSAVFLIVGNTLRFTILAHKEEIQVMKLIGASDSFILRPYLYSGMWFGLIGAVCAWVLTAAMTVAANGAVERLAMLYDSQFRLIGLNWDESLLLLMLGIFLGYCAALLSAKKHMKEIEPV
ncbi:permease-like cell division protein FtsX [Vibrio sp. TH_r3]|uniref:permease-like cell division protein FtsX n=1 Tax=Vibrio sp. TH_r3 TaxID=3082084 RepID=UPI0029550C71|nr:permease-like cell division protein FtsX [Vibrio sp. TH_r3]MDV7106048.1 permease-like cell division protein FtsX [Vibrio sp. TH_r3]